MQPANSIAYRRSPTSTAIVFIVCALAAAVLIWFTETSRIEQERSRVSNLAGEYALALQMNIENALSATYALATMIELNHGNRRDFATTAAALRSFYPGIAALELAPGGVVSDISPLAGNEKALGHNLLTDPERDKEAFLARETGKLTLAGPFNLVQGGQGAAGRLPVYLRDEKGQRRFWGFVIVLIHFPGLLGPARLPALVERGYDYALWRVHPDTGRRQMIVSSSSTPLIDPVNRAVQVPNASWTLSVAPCGGWISPAMLAMKAAIALFIALLATASWRTLVAK
ncbi:CHASE domain-containing protein, partial [Noviherbaspirillum autotrophicum]|uniref:CHASE domain-containing protein n=1 Tax=Noviherbaspirillum autotrophicum TaxID=709839 RepID=UPI00058944AB